MAPEDTSVGQISRDAVYTLQEIQRRSRLGGHALRMARRAGLQVKYFGRCGFVLGSDFIDFIRSTGKPEK